VALTNQSAVDLARKPLNDDEAPQRYPDDRLMAYCNSALLLALDKAPHLFFGLYSNAAVLPNGERALGDQFPLPARYLQAVADYITSAAEFQEDEHVDSGRAKLMLDKFIAELGIA